MRRRFFVTFVAGPFAVSAVAVEASSRPSWFRRSLWGAVVALTMFIAGCANSPTGPDPANSGNPTRQAVNLINGLVTVGISPEDHPLPSFSSAAVTKLVVPGSDFEISVDNLFLNYRFLVVLIQPGMYPGFAAGRAPGTVFQRRLGTNPSWKETGGSGVVRFVFDPSEYPGMTVNADGRVPLDTVMIVSGHGIDNEFAPQSNLVRLRILTFKDLSGQAVNYPVSFQASLQRMPNPFFMLASFIGNMTEPRW